MYISLRTAIGYTPDNVVVLRCHFNIIVVYDLSTWFKSGLCI